MYEGTDEQELARLCSEKNQLAEDELYRRYAARLFTLCRRYTSSKEDAQDLLHEALIKAIEKMPGFTYKGKGSLYAWISRLTVNMALNNIRRNKLRFILTDFSVADQTPEPDPEEVADIGSEKVLELISSLPQVRRAVFNLYCIDGHSHREIGEMLGISEKASASTLTKARSQLKKMINDYLEENE